jgi:hypothetical protein
MGFLVLCGWGDHEVQLADLDEIAVDHVGAGFGELYGFVVSGDFDDEEAAKDFLRFAEGAFGDEELAVLGAHAAAGAVYKLLAASEEVLLDEAVAPGGVAADQGLDLLGREVVVVVDGAAE